jgi:hypothetical protein
VHEANDIIQALRQQPAVEVVALDEYAIFNATCAMLEHQFGKGSFSNKAQHPKGADKIVRKILSAYLGSRPHPVSTKNMANTLLNYVKRSGQSLGQISAAINVSKSTLSRIANGKDCQASVWFKIAAHIDCSGPASPQPDSALVDALIENAVSGIMAYARGAGRDPDLAGEIMRENMEATLKAKGEHEGNR